MFGSSSTTTTAAVKEADPLPTTPTYASGSARPSGTASGSASSGYAGTIMTSGQGALNAAPTARKSLLGQ
jgi:hypothetical protein